jgi:uncharacterized protein (TIGR03663 family)
MSGRTVRAVEARQGRLNSRGKLVPREGLTLEVALYGAILVAGAWLRFYALGRSPLGEGEASLAQQAWAYYWHGPAGADAVEVPFLFWGNVLSFLMLGGSDYTARMVSALAGTALVACPALARHWLGRWGALATSLILALSSTLLYLSRTLSQDMGALAAFSFLAIGFFRWLEWGRDADAYLAAGALAVGLTTGPAFYDLLAMLASFWLLVWLVQRVGPARLGWWEMLQGRWREAEARRGLWPRVGMGALVAFLLLSCGLGTHLPGLRSAIDSFPRWLASFRSSWDGMLLRHHLGVLGIYEFGILILGAVGLALALRRGNSPFLLALAYWALAMLVLNAVRPGPWGGGAGHMLMPFALGAGFLGGRLAERLETSFTWREAAVGLLGLGMGLYILLWLAGFARERPPNSVVLAGREILLPALLYVYLGLLGLLGLALFSWRWLGRERTLSLGGTLALLYALSFSAHTSLSLNFYADTGPSERLVAPATSADVRRMVGMLEAYSLQREGDKHLIGVEVDGRLQSVLGWYLRDFKQVRFVRVPHLSIQSPVAVVLPGEWPGGDEDFVCQSLKLEESWQPSAFDGPRWWRWYLYREVEGGYQAQNLELCILEQAIPSG